MMKLVALTDYKDRFGSKHFDNPYRSGMDKIKLRSYFAEYGIDLSYIPMSNAWSDFPKNQNCFIYTSSEDNGYLYKSYIEDIVLGLIQKGKRAVPEYIHLKANNNKGFMEFLRMNTGDEELNSIQTKFFGTTEEMMKCEFHFPVVVKKAAGASGRGVFKASSMAELIKVSNTVAKSHSFWLDLKDWMRKRKHSGYIQDSRNRNKFVVQNFIPNLNNDWKVYWFCGEIYIFYRPILKHRDFIASGGGYDNYSYGEDAFRPSGLFEFVERVMAFFEVPHASLDIAYDGASFHLLEIQFVYFGTAGIPYSKGYYKKCNGEWIFQPEVREIEHVYAKAIASFIKHEA